MKNFGPVCDLNNSRLEEKNLVEKAKVVQAFHYIQKNCKQKNSSIDLTHDVCVVKIQNKEYVVEMLIFPDLQCIPQRFNHFQSQPSNLQRQWRKNREQTRNQQNLEKIPDYKINAKCNILKIIIRSLTTND